ncbi:MAG: haloacid dehalogenase type II [Alphaproteobacteria bacterium]|nr:haloacid dehalogenase type II [Alphaproteobacteria bacterium]
MRINDFSVLAFDCYGTLIDWEAGILAELTPWLRRNGGTQADDAILEAFGAAESSVEAESPFRLYPDVLAEVHRRLAVTWGIAKDEAAARAFGASVGRWPAFADSAESLRYLKQHYKLVILSNVDRASFAESNKKLGVTFDRICTAQDVGSYKPSPRNFDYLLKEMAGMGIAKERILHTAQSLFHDHAPAKAAGLRTIWINRRKGRPGGGATPPAEAKPDWEVASLAEMVALHKRAG